MKNEKSLLIDQYSSINDEEEPIPSFVRNAKRRFILTIPSQESKETRRDRFISIKICYLCMFLSSVSFSITLSSMWPFLLIIDPQSTAEFFGWVVSVFSIGQLIASPIFGLMANRLRSHKIPILITLSITLVGNVIYFYLEATDRLNLLPPRIWMLVARFIMGLGAGLAAVIRSYTSMGTSVEERTSVLANISACQGLGFILGPVIQVCMVPFGYPGIVDMVEFRLNLYTSPALFSFIIYVGIIIVVVYKFNEYVVMDVNVISQSYGSGSKDQQDLPKTIADLPPPDYVAIALSLLLFFFNASIFSFLETVVSPLSTDMFAWSKKKAALYNGIILGGFGVLAVITVMAGKSLVKKYKEKYLMLFGYVILLVSMVILLPWGDERPPLQIATFAPSIRNTTTPIYGNSSTTNPKTTTVSTTEDPPTGCPANYDWCYTTPVIQLYQFLIGFALLISGYSLTNVMSFTIYSKLIGPRPQGFWQGILTSFGSLARTIGPIAVSTLYDGYGPRFTFSAVGGLVLLNILTILLTLKRYEPYKFS